jgi:hypothetical protein
MVTAMAARDEAWPWRVQGGEALIGHRGERPHVEEADGASGGVHRRRRHGGRVVLTILTLFAVTTLANLDLGLLAGDVLGSATQEACSWLPTPALGCRRQRTST